MTGRYVLAPNLYFSCSGAGWSVVETDGTFGILLTSEVRLQQDGEGGSSASQRLRRGALDPKGVLLASVFPRPEHPF